MTEQKSVLNIRDAAQCLGVSVNTLYSWVNQRKIEYIKVGRLVKFKQASLDRYLSERTVAPREL